MAHRVETDRCGVCREVIGSKPFIALNRYIVGSGQHSCVFSAEHEGEYKYEENEEGTKVVAMSGTWLCYPGCFTTFMSMKMAEVDIDENS